MQAADALPKLNKFSRARNPKTKPPSDAVFAGVGVRKTKNPSKVTVESRIHEFPTETLCKSGGVLFCRSCKNPLPAHSPASHRTLSCVTPHTLLRTVHSPAHSPAHISSTTPLSRAPPPLLCCRSCKKPLQLLKQTIKIHTESAMHKTNKLQFWDERHDDAEVKQIIGDYFSSNPDVAHGSLSEDTLLFRWRWVEKCMETGIPLNKLDGLRGLIEKRDLLTDSSHMATFVPQILEREKATINGEIKDQKGCVIFDGTSRWGEVVVLVWRQCDADFRLLQRLVSVKTTEKHMTGLELFRLLCALPPCPALPCPALPFHPHLLS